MSKSVGNVVTPLPYLERYTADETGRFDVFDYAGALQAIESFFFTRFTDAYIELAKHRARSEDNPVGAASARAALRGLRHPSSTTSPSRTTWRVSPRLPPH
jgi:valyl-tRNA synthetase